MSRGDTYTADKPCVHGHPPVRYVKYGRCVQCAAESSRQQNADGYVRNRCVNGVGGLELHREGMRKWRRDNPKKRLLYAAKSSAKNRGFCFDLTEEDIVIGTHCPCCTDPFDFAYEGRRFKTPSVDRLDSARGYISGNVHVICWQCNFIKLNATADQLEKIAAWVRRQQIQQPSV